MTIVEMVAEADRLITEANEMISKAEDILDTATLVDLPQTYDEWAARQRRSRSMSSNIDFYGNQWRPR